MGTDRIGEADILKLGVLLKKYKTNDALSLFIFGSTGSWLLCMDFSLVAVSRGYSLSRCTGFSLQWLLLSWSSGSRHENFNS